jgi:hypothetical protein
VPWGEGLKLVGDENTPFRTKKGLTHHGCLPESFLKEKHIFKAYTELVERFTY